MTAAGTNPCHWNVREAGPGHFFCRNQLKIADRWPSWSITEVITIKVQKLWPHSVASEITEELRKQKGNKKGWILFYKRFQSAAFMCEKKVFQVTSYSVSDKVLENQNWATLLDSAQLGSTRLDLAWLGLTQLDSIWLGLTWLGSTQLGLAWLSLSELVILLNISLRT